MTFAKLQPQFLKHGDRVRTTRSLFLSEREQDELLKICIHSPTVDGHALGWITKEAFRGMHEHGRMLSVHNNDDLVGYIVWGLSQNSLRIFLTWVRNDARLILHGRALVTHAERIGANLGTDHIGLWCAVDLAANTFWRALGFNQVCWRWGKAKKSRRHWLWRRPIGTNPGELIQPAPATLLLPTAYE